MTSKLFNLMHMAQKVAVMLICALALVACGSDGDGSGDDGNGGGTSSQPKNENKNPASGYDTNKTSLKAAHPHGSFQRSSPQEYAPCRTAPQGNQTGVHVYLCLVTCLPLNLCPGLHKPVNHFQIFVLSSSHKTFITIIVILHKKAA
mgnify:CR=1 FL=1